MVREKAAQNASEHRAGASHHEHGLDRNPHCDPDGMTAQAGFGNGEGK
jgi:hypothetical protein